MYYMFIEFGSLVNKILATSVLVIGTNFFGNVK